jgi:hypothetical protein
MALETMHKLSCMSSKSELDLFSIPPTQVVMEKDFGKMLILLQVYLLQIRYNFYVLQILEFILT